MKVVLNSLFLLFVISYIAPICMDAHTIKEVDGNYVILEDDSEWQVGYWYQGAIKDWKPGDSLEIKYNSFWMNNIYLENATHEGYAWGVLFSPPALDKAITIQKQEQVDYNSIPIEVIVLGNGKHYRRPLSQIWPFGYSWEKGDRVFVYDPYEGYGLTVLYNLDKKEYGSWFDSNQSHASNHSPSKIKSILQLETKLNKKVIDQPEATKAVATSLINYYAGLKEPKKPIHTFLFLGPTGVGKTELAKVLAQELYGSEHDLVRFDMSHFSAKWSLTRFLGSSPGYVNSDKGGELTNALLKTPESVVLLDEIEKADPEIRKAFLPIFDDGYITSAMGVHVPCDRVLFIMTSNLCSQEILQLFHCGYDSQDILKEIEPVLIRELSPELYNRLDPIVFCPLSEKAIERIVSMFLNDLATNVQNSKGVTVLFEQSVNDYLVVNGYNPLLGARPLKRLIQKKVSPLIAHSLLTETNTKGKKMVVNYDTTTGQWAISWL